MKRLLCLAIVILLTMLMVISCSNDNKDSSSDNSYQGSVNTDDLINDSEVTDSSESTDSSTADSNTDCDIVGSDDAKDTSSDTDVGSDTNVDGDTDIGSDTNVDSGDTDIGSGDTDIGSGDTDIGSGDTDEPSNPSEVEYSTSKSASDMASSVGNSNNGDIMSGYEIALDDNVFVSFGKGTAETEPALYSGAIRIYQNGGTLTVNAKNGCKIKTIVISFTSEKSGSGKLVISDGSHAVINNDDTITITPTSVASTITVTVGGSTKNDRLYVGNIEVTYVCQGGTSSPENPGTGDDDSNDEDSKYLYNDFTADEKNTYSEYLGFIIPFLPSDDYYVEAYNDNGYKGVYYYAVCESRARFNSYLAEFSKYENNGTDIDEYGDTWYLFSKDDTFIDVCCYEFEGLYYVDVDAYYELGDDSGSGDTGDGGDENEHLYYDFKSDEKSTYQNTIGFVIPFLPNDDYYVESYNEDGYIGVYYSALCDSEAAFTWYLAMFSSYSSDGTTTDDYGDTWYCYSKNDIFVDVCYYEYEGAYYVDVDAYYESSDDNGNVEEESNIITNEGAGLPEDDGDGIYDIDFTDADKVKDVTEQFSYMDGCPTVGSPGVLVIPVEFSDRLASSLGYSIDNIKSVFEKDGKNDYYSVYDYYYLSSLGQLSLDITVVDEWFKPSHPSTYYRDYTMNVDGEEIFMGDQLIMDEALKYLDDTFDLSKYDSDSNGTIDAVVLVSTLEIDGETDFYWAYRYWNYYVDDNSYYYEYDGVRANDYLWASYKFIHEDTTLTGNYSNTDALNPYTFIHEFGHILGADDYYDTLYYGSPLGGYDIMDSELGDHNAYSKFNYGWIKSSRLVVTDTSVTLTLEDFSKNGDTIIIANNFDPSLGIYQEYYILVYYTEEGLNSGVGGYFGKNGILVYHVDASLCYEEYDGEIYYDVYNTNTEASSEYGTLNNLIELMPHGSEYVYVEGESMKEATDNTGTVLGYTFTVVQLTDDEATITVSVK